MKILGKVETIFGVRRNEAAKQDLELTEEFGLSKEDLNKIKERIQNVQGHIRFYIHPFYTTESEEMRKFFYKSLQNVNENEKSSPVFVLQDASQDRLMSSLGLDKSTSSYVFIRTFTTSGVPLLKSSKLPKSFVEDMLLDESLSEVEFSKKYEIFYKKSFDDFCRLLKAMGVKSITVAGNEIGVVKEFGEKPFLNFCIGSIVEGVRERGIKVDLSKNISSSSYTNSEMRKLIRDSGISIKDTKKYEN